MAFTNLTFSIPSGLFRSVISHSGDATAFWAMDKQNPREKAEQLATYLDCPIGNTEQTIACFKTKSAKEFTEAQMNLRVQQTNLMRNI